MSNYEDDEKRSQDERVVLECARSIFIFAYMHARTLISHLAASDRGYWKDRNPEWSFVLCGLNDRTGPGEIEVRYECESGERGVAWTVSCEGTAIGMCNEQASIDALLLAMERQTEALCDPCSEPVRALLGEAIARREMDHSIR